MATIEPKIETIIKETYVLTYDRAELEDIVADPQPLVRELRAVLNGSNAKPLKPAAPPPVSKAKRGEAGSGGKKVDQFETYPCKVCRRAFKKPGYLAQHMRKAHDGETEIGKYQPATE